MGLETKGKKVMLQAFGTAAVKVDLHNALEADAVGVGKGLLNQEAKELLRQRLLGGVHII